MVILLRVAIDDQALVLFYVDYDDKLSNLLEDLKAVERFIQSAENQENDWA